MLRSHYKSNQHLVHFHQHLLRVMEASAESHKTSVITEISENSSSRNVQNLQKRAASESSTTGPLPSEKLTSDECNTQNFDP